MPKSKTKEVAPAANTTALVDNAFTVDKAKWGTFRSFDPEGKALVTSPTEEACVEATRFYLKGLQEDWNDYAVVKYEGSVSGKL
jgi:hypothetical protein